VQCKTNASSNEVCMRTTGSVAARGGAFTLLRRRAAAGFVLVSTLTQAVGCGSTDTDASDVSGTEALRTPRMREAAAALSGEELFHGIFFGVGWSARLFPEVWSEEAQLAAAHRYLQAPDDAADIERAIERLSRGDAKKADELRRSAETQLAKLRRGDATLPGADARARLASMFVSAISQRDSVFFERFANEMKSGNAQRVSVAIDNAQSALAAILDGEDLLAGIGGGTPNGTIVVITPCTIVLIVISVSVFVTRRGVLGGPSYERDSFMLDLSQRLAPIAAQ
jgi:hypothetical protein